MSAIAHGVRGRRWIVGFVAAGVLAGCGVTAAPGSPLDAVPDPTAVAGERVQAPLFEPGAATVSTVAARNLYGPYTLTISALSVHGDVGDDGAPRLGVRVQARCTSGSCLLGPYAFTLQGPDERRAARCVEHCLEPALPAEAELETNERAEGYVTWRVEPGRYLLSYAFDGVRRPVGWIDLPA